MTYPPQSGPPQPGAQGPYQQQPYGYGASPQGPGQPGYGGRPPQKKTGLWVGIGIGAVALVALLITGFVAPGFFLGDDNDDSASPTNPPPSVSQSSPSSPPATSDTPSTPKEPERDGNPPPDGEKFLQDFLNKINTGDANGAVALLCEGRETFSKQIQDLAAAQAKLSYERFTEAPAGLTGQAAGQANGQQIAANIGAAKQSTGWCVAAVLSY